MNTSITATTHADLHKKDPQKYSRDQRGAVCRYENAMIYIGCCNVPKELTGYDTFREALDSGKPLSDRAVKNISEKMIEVLPFVRHYYSPGYTPLKYDNFEKMDKWRAEQVKTMMELIVADVKKLKCANVTAQKLLAYFP